MCESEQFLRTVRERAHFHMNCVTPPDDVQSRNESRYSCHFGNLYNINSLWCVTGGQWKIKLGTITLSVKQGDITRESTDAVVNSSNAQLQLDQGDAFCFSVAIQIQ